MQIVKVPNPVLTTPSNPVDKIDKKILELVEGMKKTLLATIDPIGVGLAAPQVGAQFRIFIAKPYLKSPISVFINPQIIEESKELTKGVPRRSKKLEGCLSIHDVWGVVHRAKKIKVKYQLLTTNKQLITRVGTFSGFLATIIQHEVDHLNGILFTQRVLEQKEKLFKLVRQPADEKGEDVFEEIEL